MAKKRITDLVEDLLAGFLAGEGYELYNTEFVKEGRDWFLRVYIDKTSGDGGIGTDDCEKVSRFLSEKLDEEDPIDQNYYLEVSSPGMDRVLLKREHYEKVLGKEIEIKLYRGIDGTKHIQGILQAVTDQTVSVTDHQGKTWELQFAEIAKAKLTVII